MHVVHDTNYDTPIVSSLTHAPERVGGFGSRALLQDFFLTTYMPWYGKKAQEDLPTEVAQRT
jgi:hypothetical protein